MPNPDANRKFHFLREIASGGFGSVFLSKVVHADGFSRIAAIKLLHPKWSENEEVASRMRDEARLLGQLRHRNIVDVIDLTMIDGRVAVIMEYLEAVDLRTMIKDAVAHGTLLPTRVVVEIAIAVASALDAAYNRPPIPGEKPLRVIHRDIKPSNVMLDESGTPKVLDFGVARADFDERESHTKEVAFGSLEYMPPERLFFEPESPASDIYSLGATLFEMLALERFGKAKLRPNQHEELIFKRLRYLFSRNPVTAEVRDDLKALLSDMLAFDEADRPTAAQSAERLRAISRRIRDDDTLAEWSEREVPRLLQLQHEGELDRPPNPLVDQVLTEDSKGFRRTPTEELFTDKTIVPDNEFGLDAPAPEDDRRWKALKEATLAEITASTEAPAIPRALRSVLPAEASKDDIATANPAPLRAGKPDEEDLETEEVEAPRVRSRTLLVMVLGAGLVVLVLGVVAAGVAALVATGSFSGEGLDVPTLTGPSERPAEPPGADEPPAAVEPPGTPPAEGVADGSSLPEEGTPDAAPPAAPEVAPEPAPAAAPAPAPAAPQAPASAGRVVTFVSRMADTKKITARCDGGSGEGTGEVVLGLDGLGDCMVTGLGTDRSRATAVVKDPQEGTYVCFEGGARTCEGPSPDEG